MSGRSGGPGPLALAAAGVGIVGVCFGMARYGYGLLLPELKRSYGLGPGVLGVIATGSYAGYLLTTVLAGVLAVRAGPRVTAVLAGSLATAGMIVAGLSRSPAVLAAGVLVGGASAGFAFAPFSDAARGLDGRAHGRVISAINSGTGYGVALAAPIALVAGAAWREAWLAFAAVGLAATLAAARVLPAAVASEGARAHRPFRAAEIWSRARRLVLTGFLVGTGSSAFWTFGVDHLREAGALAPAAGAAFLGAVGVASIAGSVTGDVVERIGVRATHTATTLAIGVSSVVLGLAPGSFALMLAMALVFGVAYNAAVAIQALWSTRLFADRPSLGISVAMGANGLGLLLGPTVAGVLVGALGSPAVFVGAGVVAGAAALAGPGAAAFAPATPSPGAPVTVRACARRSRPATSTSNATAAACSAVPASRSTPDASSR